jgi:hypothetical protein
MFIQRITHRVTVRVVSVAIDLHDETLLRTEEVYDGISDNVLPAELVAAELGPAEMRPKLRFKTRHLPAQALRSVDQMRCLPQGRSPPLPLP